MVSEAKAVKFIADGKKRLLGMPLVMNADCNKYGTLIKDYDREYLNRISKYPKTLQDAYNLLKGLNKHKKARPKISIQDWSVIQNCGRREWGSSCQ